MMNSRDKEALSAMLDNEADELEVRRILQSVGEDPELVQTWQRMSLVQALLHDDKMKISSNFTGCDVGFSDAVARAIADETLTPPVIQSKSFQWKQPLAKLGIAASVAAAFFLGMQSAVNQPAGDLPLPLAQGRSIDSTADSDANGPATSALADAEPAVRQVDPQARQRLEDYIQSVSITREEPQQLEQLQDSPLYRLVNEIQNSQ
jgi:sigma-E factor negative regulatory protein RseA